MVLANPWDVVWLFHIYIYRHIKHREVNFPEITMVVCGTESLSARIQTQTFRFKVRLRTIPEKFMFPGREITCRKPKTRIRASSAHPATECRTAGCVYVWMGVCVRACVCRLVHFGDVLLLCPRLQPAGSRRGRREEGCAAGLPRPRVGRPGPQLSLRRRRPLCSCAATA